MSLDPLLLSGARAKGKRPWFLDNPDTERLMTIVMAIAQELAVMRERLDTVERLLEKKGTLTRADIDAFTPSKDEAEARGRWTQEYLARILRILQQEREAAAGDDPSSEDIADELGRK